MIAHAQRTVVINRSIGSVFDFVLNGANNRLWKRLVLEARPLGEAPYGVGSKFQQEVRGPEGPAAADYQVTECRSNELIEIEVMSGPARWTGQYRFRSLGRATEVSYELKAEREGLHGMADAVLQSVVEQEAGTLDELKAFLEKVVA